MDVAKLVIEFLKVLLSPQVVAGVLGTLFLLRFSTEIRSLLKHGPRFRFGAFEVSTSQAERTSEAALTEAGPPAEPIEPEVPVGEGVTPSDEQIDKLREAFEAERSRATLWEYRFLNYFLVPHTRAVLDWLASLPNRTTVELFSDYWLQLISDPHERKAVLDALHAHQLIEIDEPHISVTPKGRQYLQFRRQLQGYVAQSRPS